MGVTAETRFLPRYLSAFVKSGRWNTAEISCLTQEPSRTALMAQIAGASLSGSWFPGSIPSVLTPQRGSKMYQGLSRVKG